MKEAKDGNESAGFAGGNYAIPSARESFGAAKMKRDLPLRDILSLNAYLHTELNLDQMKRSGPEESIKSDISLLFYTYQESLAFIVKASTICRMKI